ncbi:MAG TPA: GNAT family N-acetyltransferase [Thermomicrobiales bacterium]|nr:GNAT family N-acetyltransferase [Thermomicrobiales bacterium]
MNEAIEVRPLEAREAHIALDWARQEGWNPGYHDAACFHATDPRGFLTSLHEGEPAAVISVVRYGASFAFLGLYICRPDLRGRGYGFRVWQAGIAHAADRTIGLDGVPAQQDNYARSGFELAWRNARYQGVGGGEVEPGLIDLDDVPFGAIAAYDRYVFEADRRNFLRQWIAQPGAVRLGVMRDGALAGWGLLRPCAEGAKIGPLFADDQETAERLLDGLLASFPGQAVYLDVPEPNMVANRAAEARGMTPVFETARMYAGPRPEIALERVWGITSFELG